jgi:predicted ribosome quality control (RQC) complex YloA/Tae2 family protein
MKNSITSLDLHFLTQELQELIGSKVEKVYQPQKHEFLIVLHVPSSGKRILRISLPDYCFLTDFKGEVPEKPDPFCLVLRKYLGGSRLRSVTQLGFERILELGFETKEAKMWLFVELFSKGNIVLCTAERTIKSAWLQHKWKDRTIRGNIPYEYPKQANNFLTITKEECRAVIDGSDKESIVKTLAIDFGLGGRYAEELCVRAGIDKAQKGLSESDHEKVFASIEGLRSQKIDPCVYSGEIAPVPLIAYGDKECTRFPSYNHALAQVIDEQIANAQETVHTEKHTRELHRLERVIAEQQETIKRLHESEKENQKKAELIFENYAAVKEVLTELIRAKEKYSWKEIKERLKGHAVIKEINEKNKEVVVELR